MDRSKFPKSYYQPGKILPKYIIEDLYRILNDSNKPVAISSLTAAVTSLNEKIMIEFIEKQLYLLAHIRASSLCVVEYPSFKLKSFTKFPDFSGISRGLKYISTAAKILFTSREYVDVRDIVKNVESKRLYQFPNLVPEYWMYFFLNEYKHFFSQNKDLKIGLKEWQIETESPKQSANLPTQKSLWDDVFIDTSQANRHNVMPKMHEANLETIVVENLDTIEEGLTLIKRQYNCPGVGRIDVLCQDRSGNLVILELKKFGVKQNSIVDQITRYMGYIQTHLAKKDQNVRGMLVVASAD